MDGSSIQAAQWIDWVERVMPKKDRFLFQEKILSWYAENRRSLPWRDSNNPYFIWVSEVMLQQTQVKTVIPYYQRFIKQFPDINRLAASRQQDLLKAWEGMGYYARARNLHRAAKMVVSEHQGKIPADHKRFRALPGVGEYIAAAVLSIAFQKPLAVTDGNVKRVLARLRTVDTPVNHSSSHRVYGPLADDLLNRKKPGDHNQAMMELGALVCTPRKPICINCPVSNFCRSFRGGKVDQYPKRVQRRPIPEYRIAVGVIMKNGNLLIARRKPEGLLGGLWEFPGGKIRPNESSREACVREVREELNLAVTIERRICRVRHAYTHFKIDMDVFACRYRSGRVRRNGPAAHKWVSFKTLRKYPIPGANHKILPQLEAYLHARQNGKI
jgi:A/G-specific adenine glycosylase